MSEIEISDQTAYQQILTTELTLIEIGAKKHDLTLHHYSNTMKLHLVVRWRVPKIIGHYRNTAEFKIQMFKLILKSDSMPVLSSR